MIARVVPFPNGRGSIVGYKNATPRAFHVNNAINKYFILFFPD